MAGVVGIGRRKTLGGGDTGAGGSGAGSGDSAMGLSSTAEPSSSITTARFLPLAISALCSRLCSHLSALANPGTAGFWSFFLHASIFDDSLLGFDVFSRNYS